MGMKSNSASSQLSAPVSSLWQRAACGNQLAERQRCRLSLVQQPSQCSTDSQCRRHHRARSRSARRPRTQASRKRAFGTDVIRIRPDVLYPSLPLTWLRGIPRTHHTLLSSNSGDFMLIVRRKSTTKTTVVVALLCTLLVPESIAVRRLSAAWVGCLRLRRRGLACRGVGATPWAQGASWGP